MKKYTIIFWITTVLLVLFEGVMPALTFNTDLAREGVTHLGYPVYFLYMLTVYKVLGALALIVPRIPSRIKEWAYGGFAFVFVSAFVSHIVVDGAGVMALGPVIALVVLKLSYWSYHKRMLPVPVAAPASK